MTSVAIRTSEREHVFTWCLVVAAGGVAFAAVRLRAMLPFPHYGATAVAATIVVATLQEAVFRQFLYGRLERYGPAVAIVVSALLFAAFHWPRYGASVLPIDFAAGLIFGWQRWATGTWTAPAATHVLANLVQLW
jgi:membrane protease YdiL (CAAX protease family)